MIKKKTIRRATIKKVVRRGKLIGDFSDQAKNMTKEQLLHHMTMMRNNQDNPTYIISRKFLKMIHGMSDSDIKNAMDRIQDNHRFKQDMGLYYRGQKTPEEIISAWKNKGIKSQSDIDRIMDERSNYEIPAKIGHDKTIYQNYTPIVYNVHPASLIHKSTELVNARDLRTALDYVITAQHEVKDERRNQVMNEYKLTRPELDKLIVTRIKERGKVVKQEPIPISSSPLGQRSFVSYGYGLYDKYRKLTNDHDRKLFLLEVAANRPEFAAHIAYLLVGGNIHNELVKKGRIKEQNIIHDDFNDIVKGSFTKEVKENFIQMMNRYMRQRMLQKGSTNQISKLNPMEQIKQEMQIRKSHSYAGDYGKAENTDYGDLGNDDLQLRKRRKIKSLPKRKIIKKKIIKRKPIKKCRCK